MEKSSRSFGRFCALFFVLGLLIFPARAAQAEGDQVLGLEQLIQMALEKSPEMQEAEQSIVAAQSQLDQAKGGRWAQLDMVGIVGPSEDADEPIVVVSRKPDKHGNFIGRLQDRDHDDSLGIFGRLELAVVQPLYTFGKISHRIDAASYGVDAKRSSKDQKRGERIRDVKLLYYGLIVSMQGKGAAEDADAFSKDSRRRITRLIALKSKNVDETDLYRLDAFESEIERFKVKADTGAKMAYIALKRTVGYPANQDFKLDSTELPKVTQPLESRESYMQKALAQRPEFVQIQKGLEAKRSLMLAAKADLYPSVFVAAFGDFAGATGREELDISYFPDDFNHTSFGGVIGTQWHFDLGIGTGKVREAKAEYQKMTHTKELAERDIPLEVAKYYYDAQEAAKSVETFQKAAVASRRWIVASFSNFDIGVGTAWDMFQAIDRYGKNQGDYLLALYNYHASLANLSYAVGEYVSGK
jgi:outer membrane protein